MKNLSHKLSLFSVLALVAFEPQNLQATSTSSSAEEIQDSQKPQNSQGNGQEINKKLIEGFALYNVNQENAQAQLNLEFMYQHGKRIDQDLIKAFEFYEKSSKREYPDAQYHLGFMYLNSKMLDDDFTESIKYIKKSAKQGYPIAQYDLGVSYQNGRGVDRDLTQSLKWYLESSKNKCKIHDLKINLKSLITFVPSAITPTDEVNLTNNQKTLRTNIESFLQIHGLEKGINTLYLYKSKKGTNELIFEEGKFAISSLVEKYQRIVDFEEILLKSILASDQPGFMVTCLQPKDIDAFKSSKCPDIKYYELQGQSFLTFGQNNIAAADKLMTIFDTAHPVYGAISDILDVLIEIHKNHYTKIQMSDPARTLKKQHISRLQLSPEDAISLAGRKKLIERVESEITALRQLQAVPQQLTDLLIEGAPVRNKLFLQNNDYIDV